MTPERAMEFASKLHRSTFTGFLSAAQIAEVILAACAEDKPGASVNEHAANAAFATLHMLGYSYDGGFMWKPPLGHTDPPNASREPTAHEQEVKDLEAKLCDLEQKAASLRSGVESLEGALLRAQMWEPRAREILGKRIDDARGTFDGAFLAHNSQGQPTVHLEDDFTADDLEAIAWWLRNRPFKGFATFTREPVPRGAKL